MFSRKVISFYVWATRNYEYGFTQGCLQVGSNLVGQVGSGRIRMT